MLQILFIVIVLFLILSYLRYLRRLPAEQRRRQIFWGGFIGLLLALLYLTVTGRLHFMVTLGAALLPLLKQIPVLFKVLPWLKRVRDEANAREQTQHRQAAERTQMSHAEALKILGLEQGASRAEVMAAHRALMQKLHPDHGGNDYLAAQINQAREVLLASSSGKDSNT